MIKRIFVPAIIVTLCFVIWACKKNLDFDVTETIKPTVKVKPVSVWSLIGNGIPYSGCIDTAFYGADGGVDARVYVNGSNVLEYAIQCKAWKKIVGVKEIRELFGVMVHESAGKGAFMATSTFSDDAKSFAAEHSDKLFLVDGEKFISMLLKLPQDKQKILLSFATEGDYTTPTCASCGIKMVLRNGAKGDFWGCINFPKCNSRLWVAQA